MSTARKTILIVDDEPMIREGLRFALEMEGFDVLEAQGGHEALHLMQTRPIDLVLSDVRMPSGDGRELLIKARELDRRPPIVLMTGFADLARSEALALGASELVRKPYDLDLLINLVKQYAGPK